MAVDRVVVAVVLGVLQGVFEWLPISSEGNLVVFLTVVEGASPADAVGLSLFLHLGTAAAATAFYRDEIAEMVRLAPSWRPGDAFDGERASLTFLAVATAASGVVGIAAYVALAEAMTAFTGGAFVALIGALLVGTGVLQRVAGGVDLGGRGSPDGVDAVVVGGLQGLAILPGVSRSGVTTSGLLLRGHDGPSSFNLSFLLSIPAALGAGALAVVEAGGLPGIGPTAAAVALLASAVVGYLTIGALLRLVERVAFWGICVGLGGLMVLGGLVSVAI